MLQGHIWRISTRLLDLAKRLRPGPTRALDADVSRHSRRMPEVWSGDDGNEWEDAFTGGSNLEVFPGQPRASCQDGGEGEEEDEEVR
ncbi:hypothetical protein ALC57_05705 [Trachymyrmex cornetzi]|uniref:Uncharacterized protein n=1 Tax=Trachymyrmex cornetzi TaxID=471704 RepID=A0A151JA52_9HYME|nr:hypothetical protein ALC57_05705 [Trachymyrmex cornetzi]